MPAKQRHVHKTLLKAVALPLLGGTALDASLPPSLLQPLPLAATDGANAGGYCAKKEAHQRPNDWAAHAKFMGTVP